MIHYFTKHPTAANVLMVFFIAVGIIALPEMKRETFPDFSSVKVQVTVPYPGATPEEVEQAICLPIEDALDGLDGLKELTCTAREGIAITTAEMTRDGNETAFVADIKTEMDAVDQFPDEVETTVVKRLGNFDDVVSLAIYSDMNKPELKLYTESLKQRLKRLPGIAQAEILGFSDPQLRIELDLFKLRQLNMSVADVAKQIEKQNVNMPSGNLKTQSRTILLRFNAQRTTPRALGNIIISSNADGAEILLRDIATIDYRFENAEQNILVNGQEAALISIKKAKSDDALDVLKQVELFTAKERLQTPAGVKFTLTNDMASLAKDRLDLLVTNGWQGFILVFAVMWLFFPWRYAIWVAMGLPVSFLASLYVMSLLGISLNMMSMVALLVAIGLLMDDAIVLSESIAHELSQNSNKLDGIILGVKRVMNGVFSSFLTTVAIFGSLAFLDGDIGLVLKAIPVTLIITLSVSLVEAFLILPHHLYKSVKESDDELPSTHFKSRFNRKFSHFQNVSLPKVIGVMVDNRYLVTGAVLMLFITTISLASSGILRFSAFPDTEGDQIQIAINLPAGSPLAETEKVVQGILTDIEISNQRFPQAEKQTLVEYVTVKYNENPETDESGEHVALINIELLTSELRSTPMALFLTDLKTEIGVIPGLSSLVIREPALGPAGRAIEVQLSHPDLNILKQSGQQLARHLSRFDGVSNIVTDLTDGKPEMRMSLLPGAASYGITGQDVASQLRAAFFGSTIDELQINGENVELDIRLAKRYRADQAYFEDFPVILADGRQIPLANIVKIELTRGVSQIKRIDNIRTMTLKGDIDKRVTNTAMLMKPLQAEFVPQLQQQYPGLEVQLAGETESSAETGKSMVRNFSIGLFIVFAILSFQFRSYVEPVIVMIAIPLALIGVFWGHLLMGHDMTMPSMLGFTSLAGIVVNNSILLVQFIKADLLVNQDIKTAAIQATQQRIRAILITTATTTAGLTPILLERSLQAQVLIPLVIAIIFGLLASTLLLILVLPSLYGILDDFKLTERHQA